MRGVTGKLATRRVLDRRMLRRLCFVALVACSSSPHHTAPPVGDHGVDIANLESQLPPYLASIGEGVVNQTLSGFVLVAQHDQVLYAHAFGFANRDKQRPATADTSFRIGSVTKQFTAAAILRLEQDGKLSVQDTVGKLLPEYAGPAKAVTVHQLLTHTAGVPSYTENAPLMERRATAITVNDLLATFSNLPLEFEPGSKFRYSNSGYIILGAIIERVSKMPYKQYLATKLFGPAKLRHTEVGDATAETDRADGYTLDADKLVAAHPIDMSFPFAAGAVRSTANDLVRWHRALADDTILNATERAKLYTPALDKYAYGWRITEEKGHQVIGHNGGIDGFGTFYLRVPDADLVIVAWSNVEAVAADPAGQAALAAALGDKLTPLAKIEVVAADPAVIARVTGTYKLTDESRAQIIALGAPQTLVDAIASMDLSGIPEGILMKAIGQAGANMVPTADGSYYNLPNKVRLRFAADGKSFVLEQNTLKITYQR